MAINNAAVITPSGGYIFLADPGTAAPAPEDLATLNLLTGPTDWDSIGHTSRDTLPEFGFEGGDTEVRGTWQNENLREVVTEAAADYLTIQLHQFDEQTLELYYGLNSSTTPGIFGVAGGTRAPVEKALLCVIVDGGVRIAFYAPKASIRRDEAISLETDQFSAFPVRATFLKHNELDLFQWISEDTLGPIVP